MTWDLRSNKPGQNLATRIHANNTKHAANPLLGLLTPDENKNWITGYRGEQIIGDILNTLKPHGYTIIHSIQIGARGADIDHLIISPTGLIHIINTKHHPDKTIHINGHGIKVDGQPRNHIIQALDDTDRIKKQLHPLGISRRDIKPIIALVGIKNITVDKHAPVKILLDRELIPHLHAQELTRKTDGKPNQPCPPELYNPHFWQPNAKQVDTAQADALDTKLLIEDMLTLAAALAIPAYKMAAKLIAKRRVK